MITEKLMLIITPLAGGVSMILFLVFLFTGHMAIVDLGLPESAVLTWNIFLSVIFFVQHSGMIRSGFRSRLSALIPSHCMDAAYALVSAVVLTLVVVLWQPSDTIVYELHGLSRWGLRSLFIMAMIGIVWGFRSLVSFDPFGRIPIRNHTLGTSPRSQSFIIRGPYLWVRHPLYSFTLLLIWSCPDLHLDRFLFNVLWTAWIVIGTKLEEKDLVSELGDDYRRYQNEVPMLIPWKGRRRI